VPILVDTREQRPYDFGTHPVIEFALPSGDYSLLHLEHCVAIERKAAGDFRSCVSHERVRFEKELHRLARMDFACVIIEADMRELLKPKVFVPGRRPLSGSSILGSMSAWSTRYGVHFLLASNWLHGRELCYRLLRRWWLDRTFVFGKASGGVAPGVEEKFGNASGGEERIHASKAVDSVAQAG